MTTITKECERDGCRTEINYGIETRPEVKPKYCSAKCRDIDQNRNGYGGRGGWE